MTPNPSRKTGGPPPRTRTDRGSQPQRTTGSPLWGTGVRATLKTCIAFVRCTFRQHRWTVYQVTHPSVPALNGWRLHCGDCGHPGTWLDG